MPRKRSGTGETDYHALLLDCSVAGVAVVSAETFQITYANRTLCEMLGWAADGLLGRDFRQFVAADDRERVAAWAGDDRRADIRLLRADGQIVWVNARAARLPREDGEALAFSVYDITGFKEGEERRRELSRLARHQEDQLVHSTRLAEMGEMAAGVAHELNQPLTGIKNFARNAFYMLEEGAGGLDEVKENLRLISGQVDRAAKIISQMRELARHTERQFAPVEVNSILRETVEFLTPQMKLSNVEIEVNLADSLPQVFADRIRLEQVFLNLLTNARQATEDCPERRVYVRTRHEAGVPLPVVVEIADTGKGFTPEVAERLFTPFFSTKKARHGTGLGLSISLTIIKDHQGTIVASGAPGRGASFVVRLPALDEEETP